MSSKSSVGKSAVDSKSKTKAVLLMLDKLLCGSNPDREQTRFLCHKLLHLVSNHESSKKEILSKTGLETVLSILETCNDQTTCLALVNTLNEISSGNGVKRLVAHDVTRVLLHTVAYLGKDSDHRLLTALLSLSIKIAPKDRRFALRVRLAGALPILLSIIRSSSSHSSSNKLLSNALACLKICSSNGVNASVLGRLGAIHVMQKLISSLGRKQPILMKTALSTLSYLVKSSRNNVNHALSGGVVKQLLTLHQDWHKNDVKNHRHIPARKSMLNILKHLTGSKRGKRIFVEANGMQILYRTCKECVSITCPKPAEPLLNVATLILRRCQPRFRLPIPTVQCSFKYRLPCCEEKRLENIANPDFMEFPCCVDDVIDASEDDEDDVSEYTDDILEEGEANAGESRKQSVVESKSYNPPSTSSSDRLTLKRSSQDLSDMYKCFFPELLDFQLPKETVEENNAEENPDLGQKKHLTFPLLNENVSGFGDRLFNVASGLSERGLKNSNDKCGDHCSNSAAANSSHAFPGAELPNSLSRDYQYYFARHTHETMTENGGMYRPPATAPSGVARYDNSERSSTHFPQINYKYGTCTSNRHVFECCEETDHSILMKKLASSTKSVKQDINTLAIADSIGHFPPTIPEPQVMKKYGVQKVKMLEDVARTLGHGDIKNKIVYARDSDFRPPRSDSFQKTDTNGDLFDSYAFAVPLPYNSGKLFQEMGATPNRNIAGSGKGGDFLSNKIAGYSDADVRNSEFQDEIYKDSPIITEPFFSEQAPPTPDTMKLPHVNVNSEELTKTGSSRICSGAVNPLAFRSDFECGNLRTAIQVRDFEYDLILDSDCNSNHHHQWFYFEVSNVKTGIPYRFNIVNCEKSNSQFNFGMQPLMYSVTEANFGSPCWRRVGTDLCYYKSHFSRSVTSAGGVKGRSYFVMTFTVTFLHNNDICYFSYHYPYTYTQLKCDLHELLNQVDQEKVYVRIQSLCDTLAGNVVPVVTVTAPPSSDDEEAMIEFRSRPYVFLSARVHPGESNSSWTMQGTLKLLFSSEDSLYADPKMSEVADHLRRSYIFKIVPMLNPDGVINGHHRCSLTGEDLNRQWTDPDPALFPTIYHTKGLLQYLYSIGKAPLVYCDYHGHSRRKNVFMYGCSRRESVLAGESDAIHGGPDDIGYKTLPKLLQQLAPSFSLSNCNFVVEKCKESTARVVVWKEMGVTRSYTMESTYCGCDQGKYKNFQISTHELQEMGARLCEALLYLKVKDRARSLPLYDTANCEQSSTKDIDEANTSLKQSNIRERDSDWNSSLEHSEYRFSFGSVDCPANSDDELTPEEVLGPLSSCEIDICSSSLPRESEAIGSSCLRNRFWNFQEYDQEDLSDQQFDSDEPKSDPAVTLRPETHALLVEDAHTHLGYRTSISTGRICYDSFPIHQEERDLASMLESGCSIRDSV